MKQNEQSWILTEQFSQLLIFSLLLFRRTKERALNDQETCVEEFFKSFTPEGFVPLAKEVIAGAPHLIEGLNHINDAEFSQLKFHVQQPGPGFIDRLVLNTSPVHVHLPGGEDGLKANDYLLCITPDKDRDVLSLVEPLSGEGSKGGKFGVLKPFLFNIGPSEGQEIRH